MSRLWPAGAPDGGHRFLEPFLEYARCLQSLRHGAPAEGRFLPRGNRLELRADGLRHPADSFILLKPRLGQWPHRSEDRRGDGAHRATVYPCTLLAAMARDLLRILAGATTLGGAPDGRLAHSA